MIVRVCCLLLACSLNFGLPRASAVEAPTFEVSQTGARFERQLQVRQSAFEHQAPREVAPLEDVRIFTPLSPVILEAEPVKLPADQEID